MDYAHATNGYSAPPSLYHYEFYALDEFERVTIVVRTLDATDYQNRSTFIEQAAKPILNALQLDHAHVPVKRVRFIVIDRDAVWNEVRWLRPDYTAPFFRELADESRAYLQRRLDRDWDFSAVNGIH